MTKKNIVHLKNTISDLKNKNLSINKHKQEIEKLKKQLNENEEYFSNEEKNRIEKDNEIKRYKQEIQELKEKLNDKNDYKKTKEEKIYANIPYLETEEEAAENIVDIYEQKDNKARTFAPPYNVEEEADIYERKEKSDLNEYGINIDGLDRDGYNINGLDEYGLDRDGYNINGVNKNGIDRNGYNINGIEGTRKKYSKRKVNYKEDDDGNLYDQYGFNSEGFNKDGYNIDGFDTDGFDIDGLNKDGLNKFGYAKKIGKGFNISALPILLSKIYTNNSSKELIKNFKQLVNNLYKNKRITKQVYNTLNKALIKNDS